MKMDDLHGKSVVILGLGQEGAATFRYLRDRMRDKLIGLADQMNLERLSPEIQRAIGTDPLIKCHLGEGYLEGLPLYDVIVKAPGIPLSMPALQQALAAGKTLTSHTEIFFSNCPGVIIGVTGTKGKSTTASLIQAILSAGGFQSFLVGNIGNPPLRFLDRAGPETFFVYELSSHQLDGLSKSPHIAVVLNIVPEHLDYYRDFEAYAAAKRNIAGHQTEGDFLIYNADHPLPVSFAAASRARGIPFSLRSPLRPGCFLEDGRVIYCSPEGSQSVLLRVDDVPLPGTFNLNNVLPAAAVGHLLGVPADSISSAIRGFRPLEHRLELVGTFDGVTFYDDALATVPEATMGALDALGSGVQTILLGGYERHLDFSGLADRLMRSGVETVILFPTTGRRIWEALEACRHLRPTMPEAFFVEGMAEAVAVAYARTTPGKVCLHSPASPSFGLFRNYRQRGDLFKRYVRLGKRQGVRITESPGAEGKGT